MQIINNVLNYTKYAYYASSKYLHKNYAKIRNVLGNALRLGPYSKLNCAKTTHWQIIVLRSRYEKIHWQVTTQITQVSKKYADFTPPTLLMPAYAIRLLIPNLPRVAKTIKRFFLVSFCHKRIYLVKMRSFHKSRSLTRNGFMVLEFDAQTALVPALLSSAV